MHGALVLESSLHSHQLHDCIQRMQNGDARASEELVYAAGARLERMAHRMLREFPNVRRLADSDDVLQGAVFRLLRSLRQMDTAPTCVRDFLNLAAAHIRRELLDLARYCGTAKRRGDVPFDA